MKTKHYKLIFTCAVMIMALFTSVIIIKANMALLRVEFLNHAKGQTLQFINSYIN